MNFRMRFSDTRLEEDRSRLRLIGPADEVLLELKGAEIEEAVRAGFVDRDNFHFSMFEYARIRAIAPAPASVPVAKPSGRAASAEFDREFLADLHIAWD